MNKILLATVTGVFASTFSMIGIAGSECAAYVNLANQNSMPSYNFYVENIGAIQNCLATCSKDLGNGQSTAFNCSALKSMAATASFAVDYQSLSPTYNTSKNGLNSNYSVASQHGYQAKTYQRQASHRYHYRYVAPIISTPHSTHQHSSRAKINWF